MSFASEDCLLIQCCRTELNNEARDTAAKLLQSDLDWDYVLEVSIRHGVSPLLYYGLKQLSQTVELDQLVPERVRDELLRLYRGNQSRNRRLYRVIGEIVRACDRLGIHIMGLKDVQLARQVYPDIGLRPMGDIDILIHQRDYDRLAACMNGLGFVPLPDPDIPFTLKYAWAHHFHRPGDHVWVDVQWNVMQREWDVYGEGSFCFEPDGMWQGAIPMPLDDCHILVPKPEDMLFHLCLHLEGHQYCELILFCDIAELLGRYGNRLDWNYFVSLAQKYRAESSIYYVLFLTQCLFEMSLPSLVLRQLEPDYFKANLFDPLFSNLTSLHLSLDEIRLAVRPPAEVMQRFESTVRRQAVGAMQLYTELDEIASEFTSSGGAAIILNGAPSQKVFPDPALRPFEDMRLLILDRDLAHIEQVLSERGYKLEGARGCKMYHRQWEVTSADPVLAGQPTILSLWAEVENDPDRLFRSENSSVSKRDVALRSLRARLGPRKDDVARMSARVTIAALAPDDMLLWLSVELGRQQQNRLFGLCSLLDFLRRYSGSFDWQRIASTAQRYRVSEFACAGLLMVEGLLDDERISPSVASALACAGERPRVLEWARYDPTSWGRYTAFKQVFFCAFSFLSLDGAGTKARYLFRSLFGGQGYRPVLPGLTLAVAQAVFSSLRRGHPTTKDFAYWIEPEPSMQAEGQA